MSGAKVLAEAINGYVRGMQIRKGMDRDEEERAFREEQRDNARTDRARQDDERRQIQEAYRPVDVQEGAGGALKPDTMDNRDVGLPGEAAVDPAAGAYRVSGKNFTDRSAADAAAAAGNTQEAQDSRASAAYRRIGKPMEAAQLESANIQAKAAKFTLDKGQQEFVDKQFDKKLASIRSAEDLAGVLSKSPLSQGREVTSAVSPDGKTVDLIAHLEDGTTVKMTKDAIPNTPDGIKKAIVTFSQSMDPVQKVAALQHFDTFEEQRRQFEENKRIQQEQFAENKRLQEKQIGISAGHLAVSQSQLGLAREKMENDKKNDPMYSLPAAVKVTVQGHDRVIAGIEKAITDAQAQGNWDEKSEGAKALRVRLVKAQEAKDKLMTPYLGGAPAGQPAAGADYMGYGKSAPGAGSPAPAKAPALTMPARSQAAAGAGPAPQQPDIPQGQALDAARSTYDQAVQRLNTWGLAQRQRDPQGYRAAQQAVVDAKAQRESAEAAYGQVVQPGPALTYPRPM